MRRTTHAFALLATLGAVFIAGCGGGSSSSSTATSASSGGGTTVGTSEVAGLGTVLVDSEGMTVYELTEGKGATSGCYGGCEAKWPPVTASGKPSAGDGAMAADLGTSERKDGTLQVTYNGHPLYTFAADKAPGEANGNEADGIWFALNKAGSAVAGKATPSAAAGKATPSAAAGEGESEAAAGGEEESGESSGGYGY